MVTIAAPIPARRRTVWGGAALAALVLLAWPLVIDEGFLLHIAILVLLTAIGAASLHLILRMGQLSLCHAAFMGLGGSRSTRPCFHDSRHSRRPSVPARQRPPPSAYCCAASPANPECKQPDYG